MQNYSSPSSLSQAPARIVAAVCRGDDEGVVVFVRIDADGAAHLPDQLYVVERDLVDDRL